MIGYRGEPYLRYLPGGIVEENANSPTTYLNIDRYAAVEVPPTASAVAEPDWRVVAEDGSYAWHDHRAHWMNTARPPGRAPGDVILEGVIPLRVSGIEVDVGVRSLWVAAPSILPVLAGMMAGLALVAAAALRKVRPVALAAMLAAVSAAAAGVGLTAYLSVPPETGPSWALWAPPAASAVAAGAAAAGRWFRPLATWSGTLSVIAALELVVWGFLRREWMWSAIVPTEVPWLDRAVTGAVLVAGIGLLMLVGRALAAGGTTGARSA